MSEAETQNKHPRKRWKRAGIILLVIVLSFFSLSLIVHLPVVQNWGIGLVSRYVAEKTGSAVKVGSFRLNVLGNIIFQDVYLSQQNAPTDTLIYAGEFGVRFTRLWKLFSGTPQISRINLRKARVYIDHRPLTFLALTGKPSGRRSAILIYDPTIVLDDILVRITQHDHITKVFEVPRGLVNIHEINTEARILDVRAIHLNSPSVAFYQHKEKAEAVPTDKELDDSPAYVDSVQWVFGISEIIVLDGRFRYQQDSALWVPAGMPGINYHDIYLTDLDLAIQDMRIDQNTVQATIEELAFHEQSGFVIEGMRAQSVFVSSDGIALGGLEINTPRSAIGDTISVRIERDQPDAPLADRLILYARLRNTEVAISDLLAAIPVVRGSALFEQNREEIMRIDGVLSGGLNRLRADDLTMRLGEMFFAGQFRSRNLTVPGKQVLNLSVNLARFTPRDLQRHFNVRIPENFSKLGTIQFQGRFDGFLDDFVAHGKVQTALGSAETDMNFASSNGISRYSGTMSLRNFDLRRWTDNPDLGSISANLRLTDGSGLTTETAKATISGSITALDFRGYTYRDILVDGRLDQYQFDGSLEIEDPNIDLVFKGSVQADGEVPVFDFSAEIRKLHLHKLNLSRDTLILAGDFEAKGRGNSISSFDGRLQASDVIIYNFGQEHILDTVFVDISREADGQRLIRTTSDYVDGWVRGDFNINALYPSVAWYLEKSYPQYFNGLKYNSELVDTHTAVSFEVRLNEPEEWGGLLDLRNIKFRNLEATGVINLQKDSVVIDISVPNIHYDNVSAYVVNARLESVAGYAESAFSAVAIDIDERYFFDEVSASIYTLDTGFHWTIAADDLLEELNTLDLSGTLIPGRNNSYTLHLDPEIIEVLDQQWELRRGNRIRFGPGFVELQDVVFQNGSQVITISDLDRRGILALAQDFDLSVINQLWDYDKLDFAGRYDLRVSLLDIFQKEEFQLSLEVPEVLINEDSYGRLSVIGRMARLGQPVLVSMALGKSGVRVQGDLSYYPPMQEVDTLLHNTIDFRIALDTFPLTFFEYLLSDGIHNTVGYAHGRLAITGPLSETTMDGNAMLHNAATTITYLGARYTFDKQQVRITEALIDATDAILTDPEGNTAVVEGGLTHRRFGKLGLNARISSPRIVALNTTRSDNSTYYGRGIGAVDVQFRGIIERPSISVDATTAQGTAIAIHIASAAAERQKSFIRFRDEDTPGLTGLRSQTSITGMNFDMNLTATPEAVIEIVLEEDPPESIVGSGTGDIQLSITRTGDFTMYGGYEIDRGSYLFRSLLVVNKPFELLSGGTIQWSGDPYNAVINLTAEYVGLRASLSTLLAEYLTNASEAARREASVKTDVHLRLLLTGTLLQPEINFDFSFPNLTGELAGYADTKIRVLKSNQNALNEQVFGLLWAGSFLPSNVLQSTASLDLAGQGLTNSVSEFLSNQISAYFSNVISRWVGAEIDLDVGYTKSSLFENPAAATYDEWELRVKNRLFSDRVIIDAGANYGADNPVGTGAYFVGDYAIEYLLTPDGRLKVRFYHRNEETIEGRKNRIGVGLAWRREFDSIEEWLGGMKKDGGRAKE